MFSGSDDAGASGAPLKAAPSLGELRDALARLAAHDGAGLSEAELVDHLRAMEQLKSGLAAAQARVTGRLAATRAAAEAVTGVPADQRCRGLGHEVGLARQESPVRGRQHLGLALVLVHEMPETLAALTRGEITEWRATLIARETATLSRAHRAQVDTELAEHADQLTTAGDRKVAALARKIGYRLDPGSAIRRVRGAHTDRRVSIRPAPDTMAYLTGFLPVAHGVACKAALAHEADRLRSQGDNRTRSQIMADTLVQRVTGQATAEGIPVEINLVMTDTTLLGADQTTRHAPAHLHGYGPIPASLARQLVRDADRAWLRRLFTHPESGELVAMETRRRFFDGPLRRFLVLRDQTCRNPWCDAPIRHLDHIERAADGGPTSGDNGQGLCEACNHAKEAAGWHTRRLPGPDHLVETTTPTGHRYQSRAPDPPGLRPRRPRRYQLDIVIPAHAA
jgi:hypothetical protein